MKRRGKRQRYPGRWILAAILWLVSAGLWLAAVTIPGFAEWYAVTLYPRLVQYVGGALSVLPFSLAEPILYLAVVSLIVGVLRTLWRLLAGRSLQLSRERTVTGRWNVLVYTIQSLVIHLGVLALIFLLGAGINYHRLTFSAREGFDVEGASREELESLCCLLVEEANEAAADMQTYGDGRCLAGVQVPEQARQAMASLGEEFASLDGYYPRPKSVVISRWMTVQQITGIYSPFTMEANVNREIPDFEKIYTVCHELSHLKGFMREDEANFVAWLACRKSEEPEFRYSGALMGFIHAGNALYKYDRERYWEIRDGLCPAAETDLAYSSTYWKKYDGKAAEVHDRVNDTYLKANAQTDGVESYDRVVQLMAAYMRR